MFHCRHGMRDYRFHLHCHIEGLSSSEHIEGRQISLLHPDRIELNHFDYPNMYEQFGILWLDPLELAVTKLNSAGELGEPEFLHTGSGGTLQIRILGRIRACTEKARKERDYLRTKNNKKLDKLRTLLQP